MPGILLLGGTGYVGAAFARELVRRGWDHRLLRRSEADYTRYSILAEVLRTGRYELVINCAGYTGKPNVDACELARADTIRGNVTFPLTVAHACEATGTRWGQISSGCIFSGARVRSPGGSERVERDLMEPGVREELDQHPERFTGFTEDDVPNFSFRNGPCSFYSGSKALGEEVISGIGNPYIWRLRIPFDEFDNPRNYLSKVQRYSRVYDNVNSISHREDFARACLDLWAMRAPTGIYNVVNPGWITTRDVVARIQTHLTPSREFEFWRDDAEFYATAAKTPRSNCILDPSKLLATGVRIRSVDEALADSLTRWTPEAPSPA